VKQVNIHYLSVTWQEEKIVNHIESKRLDAKEKEPFVF
jgi:hypothetical protein